MSPVTSGSDHNSPSFSSTDHTSPLPAPSLNNPSSSAWSNQTPLPQHAIPSSILIIGAGVFGLSTALALTHRNEFTSCTITVIDRSPEQGVFPARDASSVDTSRIIRADYADPAYAALAAEAQEVWRQQSHPDDLGSEGRYAETGLIFVADDDGTATASPEQGGRKNKTGLDYARYSYENVKSLAAAASPASLSTSSSSFSASSPSLASKISELPTTETIRAAYGTGGSSGSWGYINRLSGWANAEASMDWLYRRVKATGRVRFLNGTVTSLVYSSDSNNNSDSRVQGVKLASGDIFTADLTILATGAWTPSLVDLSGRAIATGQVLAYMDLTPSEQERLKAVPTLLNLSTGYFIITPSANVLKIARHAYGYLNPTTTRTTTSTSSSSSASSSSSSSNKDSVIISSPVTHLTHPSLSIPLAEQEGMRAALHEMIPWPELRDRPFRSTKLCWYTDTPDGDFLIDYYQHPRHREEGGGGGGGGGLFLATGGSGHGFKFLPVIGERIVDCVLGRCPEAFRGKWTFEKKKMGERKENKRWDQVVTEDGSRAGAPGLILEEELGQRLF